MRNALIRFGGLNLPSKGLFYAVSSAASFGLMSFFIHLNPGQHPVSQLVFLRGVVAVLILFPFCFDELGKYFRRDSFALWSRAFAGSAGMFCYYYALQGTSSANANLLFSSSPIFVVVLAWIFLREKITRLEGFGILCILFGNFLLYLPNRSVMPGWVWAVGGGGALFASLAFFSLGAASKRYSSALIVFGFSLLSGLLVWIAPSEPWLPLTQGHGFFLFAVSLLGLSSQLLATLSFVHLKSSVATSIGRSSILFSGILDFAFGYFQPRLLEWTSYLLVIAGIYLAQQRPRSRTEGRAGAEGCSGARPRSTPLGQTPGEPPTRR